MSSWEDINLEGFNLSEKRIAIDKQIALFEISAPGKVPIGIFQVKVTKSSRREGFLAIANIAAKSKKDRFPDWISGHGSTVERALESAIEGLFNMIEKHEATKPEDFEYSDPFDF